jgi:hypothetical protein
MRIKSKSNRKREANHAKREIVSRSDFVLVRIKFENFTVFDSDLKFSIFPDSFEKIPLKSKIN